MTELFARLNSDRYGAPLSVPVPLTAQKSPCSNVQVNTLPGDKRRAERASLDSRFRTIRDASRPEARLSRVEPVSRLTIKTRDNSPPRAVEETGLTPCAIVDSDTAASGLGSPHSVRRGAANLHGEREIAAPWLALDGARNAGSPGTLGVTAGAIPVAGASDASCIGKGQR